MFLSNLFVILFEKILGRKSRSGFVLLCEMAIRFGCLSLLFVLLLSMKFALTDRFLQLLFVSVVIVAAVVSFSEHIRVNGVARMCFLTHPPPLFERKVRLTSSSFVLHPSCEV